MKAQTKELKKATSFFRHEWVILQRGIRTNPICNFSITSNL